MFENNKRGVALAQVDLVGVVFQRISCCAIKSCLLPCSLSSTTYHKQQPSVGYQLLLRPQGRRHDFWYMFEINKRGNVALAQVDLVGVVFQRSTRGHEVTRYEIRYLFKKKLLVICCSLFL